MTKEVAINYLKNFRMIYADFAPKRFIEALDYILSQPSLPSDLDEAAKDSWAVYEYRESPMGLYSTCYADGFKAGAEWQIEQFEKNRLAACDAQTKEEYDMETAFVDKIIKEQHRTPTFSDAIKHGIEWIAGQGVTKEAVIGMATEKIFINVSKQALDDLDLRPGDEVIVQIRKK